jgi:cysteine desulfurase
MPKIKKIYLDYAATTPLDPRVTKEMVLHFKKSFGNTMSLHSFGQAAKEVLEDSREKVASLMAADPEEVIFTGSATEANNLVLKGVAFANKSRGKHIIISAIEHPCIMESARWLGRQGFKITELKVDGDGLVDPREVEKALRKDTILVSVMHANNEIGTIQPIAEIGAVCRKAGVYFHTDAAQTFGKIPVNVHGMNVDLLTASSHKMYGPKGAACLFKRKSVKIEPLLHGGGHEGGLRSSTINVPAIAGFAKACELCGQEMASEAERLSRLRDKLISGILKSVKDSRLNGHAVKRLPNNVNVSFSFVEGESLMMQLDLMGIAVSTGSACSSRKLEPSHVLKAIGLKPHQIHGSLRLSLGRQTTREEIGYVIEAIPKVVEKLRKISPFSR